MNNSYNQIAHQLLKKDRNAHYNLFRAEVFEDQEKFNSDKFRMAYDILKHHYPVIFKLFGEKNFLAISYEYFKYNPLHSRKNNYGKSFSDFINSLEQLQSYPFLRWLGKLDWFWMTQKEELGSIALPKGTLASWGNCMKDMPMIDVLIDENILEKISLTQDGKEIKITAE